MIEGEGNIGNVFKVVVTDGQSCHPIDNSIPHTTIETDYDLLSKNTGFLTENAQYDNDNNADLNKALDKQTYIMGLIVEPFNKSKAFGKNTLINYIQDVLIVLQGSPKKVILKKHADNLEDNGDNQMIKQISDSLVNGDTLNTFITDLTNNSNNKVIMSSVLSALLKIDNIPAPTKKNKNKKLDIFNKKTQPIIIGTNDVIIQLEDDDDNDPTLLNKSYQGQITSPYALQSQHSAQINDVIVDILVENLVEEYLIKKVFLVVILPITFSNMVIVMIPLSIPQINIMSTKSS